MVRNEVVEAYNKDKDLKDLRSYNGKYIQYREQYIRNKRKGDYTYIVDEFDEFLIERDKKNKNKEEIYMSERLVRVQLSRDYQVAVVEVSNIENTNDFAVEKEWALSECKRLLNDVAGKPNVQPVNTTPTEYVKVQEQSKKPANGVYTKEHITTKYLKGKQWDFAIKGLNEGRIDLDKLNIARDWQESNAIVFPKKY